MRIYMIINEQWLAVLWAVFAPAFAHLVLEREYRVQTQNWSEQRDKSRRRLLKWQRTYEREHQSMAWLGAEMDDEDKSCVSTLWCVVCRKYESKICIHKNFSKAWIDGSCNQKTSNITDHALSEQHKSAMMLFRRDQAKSRHEPIASSALLFKVCCHLPWIHREKEWKRSLTSAWCLQKSIYLFWNIHQSMNWTRDTEWILARHTKIGISLGLLFTT